MVNFKRAAIGTFATASLIASTFAPAAFASTVEISGNGSNSNNRVSLDLTHQMSVSQSNDASIDNTIGISGNTGGNSASGNTGGDTSIDSGDVDSTVHVLNAANINGFSMGDCGCPSEEMMFKIHGNGTGSDSEINVNKDHSMEVTQENDTDFDTEVEANGDTGDNSSDDGTGGDSKITSGDFMSHVMIHSFANANFFNH